MLNGIELNVNNNKFNVIFDEFENESISSNDLYDKFVSIFYSIAD